MASGECRELAAKKWIRRIDLRRSTGNLIWWSAFLSFQFNQDLYPSAAGVPIAAASTSTSASSHSPCSPLLPPSLSSASSSAAHSSALTPSSIPLVGSLGQRHVAKEEDLTVPRSEAEGRVRAERLIYIGSRVHRRKIVTYLADLNASTWGMREWVVDILTHVYDSQNHM